jgi:hypothetical protein
MTKDEFRDWRHSVDLTQDEVSKRFGVSRNTIQNWEHGLSTLPATVGDLCAVWEKRLRKEMPQIGPVTLCYTDGPMFIDPYGPRGRLAMLQQEAFPTNAAAIARVKLIWKRSDVYGPFIMEKSGEFLWNQVELTAVVSGSDLGAPTVRNALAKMANYVMENPSAFARGPKPLSQVEAEKRTANIKSVGEELMQLANDSEKRLVNYGEFEEMLGRLQKLGFYPTDRQVGDVAHTIMGEEVARAVH